MADTGMDLLATSNSPYPDDTTEAKHLLRLQFIIFLMIVGVLTLFLQHVLGSFLRRSSDKLLHAIVLGTYALCYWLVTYTLGRLNSYKLYCSEFPLWAVCLLLGGTDGLTMSTLDDVNNWKSFYVKQLMKGGLAVYIVVVLGPRSGYQAPLWVILFVNVIRSYARIRSMLMTSKSHHLGKLVKPIDDYMKREHLLPGDSGQMPNPETMKGYRYIVMGEHSLNFQDIITTEDIYKYRGSHLKGQHLMDMCLSMALSKMLNRRFAGFKLPEELELQKTRHLVFQGLLAGDRSYERAFRIIEVRYTTLILPVIMVILYLWITYELFKNFHHNTHSLPLISTLCLMAVVIFLEIFQLYLHIASGWFKVALIRCYLTRPHRYYIGQMIIEIFLSFKSFCAWQAKLGQYSLLQDFDGTHRWYNCLHYVTLFLVDKKQAIGKPVKLSKQVKQAIGDSLIRAKSEGRLTNGIKLLLENSEVHQKFGWACNASDGSVTHTILVWHIATAICKHELRTRKWPCASREEYKSAVDRVSTASSLSQYCAYLVAFAPNLLPDPSSHSSFILDESIKELKRLKCQIGMSKSDKMDRMCKRLTSYDADGAKTLVAQGARLAKQLIEQDVGLLCQVLADFWAEMMLYVTPCDDAQARAHLEAMARGGEFITHLWALLTHAGVLKRDSAWPLDAV